MLRRLFTWFWVRYGKKSELWLHRHGHWFGAIAFVAALLCACLWLLQARQMAITSTAMLTHEREPVPNKFPSLDALILSQVDQNSPIGSSANDEVGTIANEIRQKLYEGSERGLTTTPSHQTAGQKAPDVPLNDNLKLRSFSFTLQKSSSSITQQFLVDERQSAALFIPAFLLPINPNERENLINSSLTQTLSRSQQLVHDINATAGIADLLKTFDGKPLFKDRQEVVTQAYIITTTGVTRVWQRNATASATRDNFNPHRIFQDRPYFWPSLEHPSVQANQFSYISKPYFDVAGNGIVYTACWGFIGTRMVSDSVLCVDSEREASLEHLLRDVIVGQPAKFSCHNKADGGHDCAIQLPDAYSSVRDSLIKVTADLDTKHRFDDLQGGLYVISSNQSAIQRWASELRFTGSALIKALLLTDVNSTFYFTVPVPRSGETDSSITEFNLYRVDLGKPHQLLLIYAFLTIIFGLTAAVCFYVLHRSRVYALQFMREVESVMAISPVAFCHLDECDHISSHNQAFRDLLGYDDDDLENKKLRDIISPGDSQVRYDIITKCREQMQFTPAYEVQMRRKDLTQINIVISGSPLYMYPHEHAKNLNQRPHTFGILLQPSETKTYNYVPLHTRDFENAIRNWHVATVTGIGTI